MSHVYLRHHQRKIILGKGRRQYANYLRVENCALIRARIPIPICNCIDEINLYHSLSSIYMQSL